METISSRSFLRFRHPILMGPYNSKSARIPAITAAEPYGYGMKPMMHISDNTVKKL